MSQQIFVENQKDALTVEALSADPRRALTFGALNLNAVTATGAGSTVPAHGYGVVLWIVRASAVTTGGTVLIQGCEKDSSVSTDWYTIATVNVTASGTSYAEILEDEWHLFLRSNLSARTDGTYTVQHLYVPRKASR